MSVMNRHSGDYIDLELAVWNDAFRWYPKYHQNNTVELFFFMVSRLTSKICKLVRGCTIFMLQWDHIMRLVIQVIKNSVWVYFSRWDARWARFKSRSPEWIKRLLW